jgi:hypothetical protein
MKFRYDKDDDVLMVWVSNDPVDYAEKASDVVVHFSKFDKPVLFEIIKASKFMKDVAGVMSLPLRVPTFQNLA